MEKILRASHQILDFVPIKNVFSLYFLHLSQHNEHVLR